MLSKAAKLCAFAAVKTPEVATEVCAQAYKNVYSACILSRFLVNVAANRYIDCVIENFLVIWTWMIARNPSHHRPDAISPGSVSPPRESISSPNLKYSLETMSTHRPSARHFGLLTRVFMAYSYSSLPLSLRPRTRNSFSTPTEISSCKRRQSAAPPQIIGQPQNRIVAPGEFASFSVVAADTRSLAYQWRFNGTNISGATNDAVLLQNVSTNNEGEYRVVLTNPSGSVTSAPALL